MTVRARISVMVRRAAFVILALAAGLAVLLLAVHLPWVQTRVSTWALAKLAARGYTVTTSSLSYNLATRSVHVDGLVVATTADPQHPFLEAARLAVTLPRSGFSGRLAVTSISGDRL